MVRKTETPRRQLAESETGEVRKSWRGRIRVALVYPNTYAVGMSNLGFQSVYRLLNDRVDMVCERAFLPTDRGRTTAAVMTVESGRPLSDFDVVAFSLSFENDYPHVLTILDKAGIPPLSSDRRSPLPLVLAGGVACFLNPEPLAPFVDCFLIGEAEALIPPFFNHYTPGGTRRDQLIALAGNVPGVYVPEFYQPAYKNDGTLASFDPIADVPARVRRVFVEDLASVATCSSILTPNTVFGDTFLIEVARGCPHGCRFCSAGYVYRPYRPRSFALLQACMAEGLAVADKIGMVGTAVSDLPEIDRLCEQAVANGIHISFSSLRADRLSSEIIAALRQSGVKTATIAPDAGTQRLRDVINKDIVDVDILNGVESLVSGGIANVKLYFMIGLPTETREDIDGVVDLCLRVKRRFLESSRKQTRIGEITVSISPFVPKPSTPFQWAAMDGIAVLKEKIKRVKAGLKGVANLRIHVDAPRWAYVQALFSRGDRRVAEVLTDLHQARGNWAKTLKATSVDTDFFASRQRPYDEVLPWDFIDHGIKRSFLKREAERADRGTRFPPCDLESCTICGVCKERT
ncbi:MAG: TIGR03960 family B12-binding radical SAM protein [Desulfobacterales bacterium]